MYRMIAGFLLMVTAFVVFLFFDHFPGVPVAKMLLGAFVGVMAMLGLTSFLEGAYAADKVRKVEIEQDSK